MGFNIFPGSCPEIWECSLKYPKRSYQKSHPASLSKKRNTLNVLPSFYPPLAFMSKSLSLFILTQFTTPQLGFSQTNSKDLAWCAGVTLFERTAVCRLGWRTGKSPTSETISSSWKRRKQRRHLSQQSLALDCTASCLSPAGCQHPLLQR